MAGDVPVAGRMGRLEAHHVLTLEDGGPPYDVDNVATLCRGCHIDEHRREVTPAQAAWRELVEDMVVSG